MIKFILCLVVLFPFASFAEKTPAEFLSWHHLPLLIKISGESDLRIKLLRNGKVVNEESHEPKVSGKWNAKESSMIVKYSTEKSKKNELKFDLKLIPAPALASKHELLINGKPVVFTQREEQILDLNVPVISEDLRKTCQKVLQAVGEGMLFSGEKSKLTNAGLRSVYVRSGINMEASLNSLSEKGRDCRYDLRFKLNPEEKTCVLEQLHLHHCAQ